MRDEWLSDQEFSPWLTRVEGDPEKAFCATCNKEFNAELSTIKRHKARKCHTTNEASRVQEQEGSTRVRQGVQPHADSSNTGVAMAKILMICFIAEHNLPFTIADHMIDLCKVMFPDSAIAQGMCMKRTKCTELTKTLSKCVTSELLKKLKHHKFSVIIDESTDVSTTKCLTVLVKYYDPDTKHIEIGTLELIDMYDDNRESVGSTGENLFEILLHTFNSNQIPLHNFVGFAADGASNIMGEHNSLSSRLRDAMPGITIFKCICHSIHLCASEAAKTLPRHCEDLLRNVYTYFSHSAKRKHSFKQAQLFLELKPHKILHACQTRWLSLHQAVARIIEQWEALKLYFKDHVAEERLKSVEYILKDLNDPSIFLYFNFLNFILPSFSRLNLMFQRDAPTVHLLYEHINQLYNNLLRYFCRSEVVEKGKTMSLDPSLSSNHKPINQIYLGTAVHGLLQTDPYIQNQPMVTHVQSRCREFMITMCLQLQKRFDLTSPFWHMASFLCPKTLLHSKSRDLMPSLYDFAKLVPRINSGDLQELDSEWRNLDTTPNVRELCAEECEITEFYNKLGEMKDNEGVHQFKNLANFALQVLALPTCNTAAVQRDSFQN